MAQAATLRLDGYREMMRALAHADRVTKRDVRAEFRKAGEHVRLDGARLFAPTDAKSAAGYRVRVRQRGIAVEQSLRKTTGQHPNFGGLQMERALIPALDENEDRTLHEIERALDRISARFNGSSL